jgi:hypothetical protein
VWLHSLLACRAPQYERNRECSHFGADWLCRGWNVNAVDSSGGIMLPNHSSLVIAEHFGTLESLYPGRIDLGVGRAPGSDGLTAGVLRRGLGNEG